MKIELVAPAKINLTLEILGKREDGYHEVRTLMQTINLSDRITIQPAEDLEVVLMGRDAGLPQNVEENLAFRAATLLRQTAGVAVRGARITLEKQIPAGAGLGGGSSDAA